MTELRQKRCRQSAPFGKLQLGHIANIFITERRIFFEPFPQERLVLPIKSAAADDLLCRHLAHLGNDILQLMIRRKIGGKRIINTADCIRLLGMAQGNQCFVNLLLCNFSVLLYKKIFIEALFYLNRKGLSVDLDIIDLIKYSKLTVEQGVFGQDIIPGIGASGGHTKNKTRCTLLHIHHFAEVPRIDLFLAANSPTTVCFAERPHIVRDSEGEDCPDFFRYSSAIGIFFLKEGQICLCIEQDLLQFLPMQCIGDNTVVAATEFRCKSTLSDPIQHLLDLCIFRLLR